MANIKHVEVLKNGVEEWNKWRENNPNESIDLRHFDFNSIPAELTYDTDGNSYQCQFWKINLSSSNLQGAKFSRLYFQETNFINANLEDAILNDVTFKFSDLSDASLRNANLKGSKFVMSKLSRANLSGASVFGISVWKTELDSANQTNLCITPSNESSLSVDSIQVAQLIYSLQDNDRLTDIINGITEKVVLILGRFTPQRKKVLDSIRANLKTHNRTAVIFDFEKPRQTTDETVNLLAKLSTIVIADLSDAKSVLQELRGLIPNSPSVIFCPIIVKGQVEPSMFDFFKPFPWVMKPIEYNEDETLSPEFVKRIIIEYEILRLKLGL